MANLPKHITDFDVATSVKPNDRLILETNVGNVSSNSVTKQVSANVLLGNSQCDVIVGGNNILSANTLIVRNKDTPANSTSFIVTQGTMFYDDDYVYVATSDNYVKRAALASF